MKEKISVSPRIDYPAKSGVFFLGGGYHSVNFFMKYDGLITFQNLLRNKETFPIKES